MFPSVQTVGGSGAQLFDEAGDPVPSLAVGALIDGGLPAGPRGSVQVLVQGVVGLLLRGVEIHTVTCVGHQNVAGPFRVTQCNGNSVFRLDGKPAVEAVRTVFRMARPEVQLLLQARTLVSLFSQSGVLRSIQRLGKFMPDGNSTLASLRFSSRVVGLSA